MAAYYLAGSHPRGPTASPINADLQGLSPLLIIVGANETLYSDAVALAAAAQRRGVQVIYQTYIGMIYVFPMFMLRTGDLAEKMRPVSSWPNERRALPDSDIVDTSRLTRRLGYAKPLG